MLEEAAGEVQRVQAALVRQLLRGVGPVLVSGLAPPAAGGSSGPGLVVAGGASPGRLPASASASPFSSFSSPAPAAGEAGGGERARWTRSSLLFSSFASSAAASADAGEAAAVAAEEDVQPGLASAVLQHLLPAALGAAALPPPPSLARPAEEAAATEPAAAAPPVERSKGQAAAERAAERAASAARVEERRRAERAATVARHAELLGIDWEAYPDLIQIAEWALDGELPENWSAHEDSEGRGFFYDEASGVSTYDNPRDDIARQLYAEEVRRRALASAVGGKHEISASTAAALRAEIEADLSA